MQMMVRIRDCPSPGASRMPDSGSRRQSRSRNASPRPNPSPRRRRPTTARAAADRHCERTRSGRRAWACTMRAISMARSSVCWAQRRSGTTRQPLTPSRQSLPPTNTRIQLLRDEPPHAVQKALRRSHQARRRLHARPHRKDTSSVGPGVRAREEAGERASETSRFARATQAIEGALAAPRRVCGACTDCCCRMTVR